MAVSGDIDGTSTAKLVDLIDMGSMRISIDDASKGGLQVASSDSNEQAAIDDDQDNRKVNRGDELVIRLLSMNVSDYSKLKDRRVYTMGLPSTVDATIRLSPDGTEASPQPWNRLDTANPVKGWARVVRHGGGFQLQVVFDGTADQTDVSFEYQFSGRLNGSVPDDADKAALAFEGGGQVSLRLAPKEEVPDVQVWKRAFWDDDPAHGAAANVAGKVRYEVTIANNAKSADGTPAPFTGKLTEVMGTDQYIAFYVGWTSLYSPQQFRGYTCDVQLGTVDKDGNFTKAASLDWYRGGNGVNNTYGMCDDQGSPSTIWDVSAGTNSVKWSGQGCYYNDRFSLDFKNLDMQGQTAIRVVYWAVPYWSGDDNSKSHNRVYTSDTSLTYDIQTADGELKTDAPLTTSAQANQVVNCPSSDDIVVKDLGEADDGRGMGWSYDSSKTSRTSGTLGRDFYSAAADPFHAYSFTAKNIDSGGDRWVELDMGPRLSSHGMTDGVEPYQVADSSRYYFHADSFASNWSGNQAAMGHNLKVKTANGDFELGDGDAADADDASSYHFYGLSPLQSMDPMTYQEVMAWLRQCYPDNWWYDSYESRVPVWCIKSVNPSWSDGTSWSTDRFVWLIVSPETFQLANDCVYKSSYNTAMLERRGGDGSYVPADAKVALFGVGNTSVDVEWCMYQRQMTKHASPPVTEQFGSQKVGTRLRMANGAFDNGWMVGSNKYWAGERWYFATSKVSADAIDQGAHNGVLTKTGTLLDDGSVLWRLDVDESYFSYLERFVKTGQGWAYSDGWALYESLSPGYTLTDTSRTYSCSNWIDLGTLQSTSDPSNYAVGQSDLVGKRGSGQSMQSGTLYCVVYSSGDGDGMGTFKMCGGLSRVGTFEGMTLTTDPKSILTPHIAGGNAYKAAGDGYMSLHMGEHEDAYGRIVVTLVYIATPTEGFDDVGVTAGGTVQSESELEMKAPGASCALFDVKAMAGVLVPGIAKSFTAAEGQGGLWDGALSTTTLAGATGYSPSLFDPSATLWKYPEWGHTSNPKGYQHVNTNGAVPMHDDMSGATATVTSAWDGTVEEMPIGRYLKLRSVGIEVSDGSTGHTALSLAQTSLDDLAAKGATFGDDSGSTTFYQINLLNPGTWDKTDPRQLVLRYDESKGMEEGFTAMFYGLSNLDSAKLTYQVEFDRDAFLADHPDAGLVTIDAANTAERSYTALTGDTAKAEVTDSSYGFSVGPATTLKAEDDAADDYATAFAGTADVGNKAVPAVYLTDTLARVTNKTPDGAKLEADGGAGEAALDAWMDAMRLDGVTIRVRSRTNPSQDVTVFDDVPYDELVKGATAGGYTFTPVDGSTLGAQFPDKYKDADGNDVLSRDLGQRVFFTFKVTMADGSDVPADTYFEVDYRQRLIDDVEAEVLGLDGAPFRALGSYEGGNVMASDQLACLIGADGAWATAGSMAGAEQLDIDEYWKLCGGDAGIGRDSHEWTLEGNAGSRGRESARDLLWESDTLFLTSHLDEDSFAAASKTGAEQHDGVNEPNSHNHAWTDLYWKHSTLKGLKAILTRDDGSTEELAAKGVEGGVLILGGTDGAQVRATLGDIEDRGNGTWGFKRRAGDAWETDNVNNPWGVESYGRYWTKAETLTAMIEGPWSKVSLSPLGYVTGELEPYGYESNELFSGIDMEGVPHGGKVDFSYTTEVDMDAVAAEAYELGLVDETPEWGLVNVGVGDDIVRVAEAASWRSPVLDAGSVTKSGAVDADLAAQGDRAFDWTVGVKAGGMRVPDYRLIDTMTAADGISDDVKGNTETAIEGTIVRDFRIADADSVLFSHEGDLTGSVDVPAADGLYGAGTLAPSDDGLFVLDLSTLEADAELTVTYKTVCPSDAFVDAGGDVTRDVSVANDVIGTAGPVRAHASAQATERGDDTAKVTKEGFQTGLASDSGWRVTVNTGAAPTRSMAVTDAMTVPDGADVRLSSMTVYENTPDGKRVLYDSASGAAAMEAFEALGYSFKGRLEVGETGFGGFELDYAAPDGSSGLPAGTSIAVEYVTHADLSDGGAAQLSNRASMTRDGGISAESGDVVQTASKDETVTKEGKLVAGSDGRMSWGIDLNLRDAFTAEQLTGAQAAALKLQGGISSDADLSGLVTVTDDVPVGLEVPEASDVTVKEGSNDLNAGADYTVLVSGRRVTVVMLTPASHPSITVRFATQALTTLDAVSNSATVELGQAATGTSSRPVRHVSTRRQAGIVRSSQLPEFSIDIVKRLDGEPSDTPFSFQVDEVDATGNRIAGGLSEVVTNAVADDEATGAVKGHATVGPLTRQPGIHLFRIAEVAGSGDEYQYDSTVYTVEETISKTDNGIYTAAQRIVSPENRETVEFSNRRLQEVDVQKIWEGDEGNEESRGTVEVKLMRSIDGEEFEPYNNMTATLSSANGWKCSWRGLPADGEWTVVEVAPEQIGENYTSNIETSKDGVVTKVNVTNSYSIQLPSTGGTGSTLMIIAGIALVAAGIVWQQVQKEQLSTTSKA